MSCVICGRGTCMKSFHSQETITMFDALEHLSERQLKLEILSLKDEVEDLKAQIKKLETSE